MNNVVESYIRSKGIQYKVVTRPSGIWALTRCPYCGENDFAISLSSGSFKCVHQRKCGVQGSFKELKLLFGDMSVQSVGGKINYEAKNNVKNVKIKVLNREAVAFLRGRGFSDNTIKKYKDILGVTEDGKNLCFVYTVGGERVSIKYRRMDKKDFYREKNTPYTLFGIDMIPPEADTIVIVEGELDVLAASEYGIDAVSVPNGSDNLLWISEMYERLKKFKHIILMLDNDEAGQKHVQEIINRLGKYRTINVLLPKKDLNECLLSGITSDEIIKLIVSTRNEYDDIVKSIVEYTSRITNYVDKYGNQTGFDKLDEVLGGWRYGELTVWSGANGSGKTNILLQLMKIQAKQGIPVLIGSFEMRPEEYFRWLVQMHLGKNYKKEDVKSVLNEYAYTMYYIDKLGSIRANDIIEIIKYAVEKYGVKFIVIDSLMRIVFKTQDKYQEERDFCVALSTLAKDYELSIHLVAHPRKTESDSDEPEKVDIAGSADITNNADNVIVVYRVLKIDGQNESKNNKSKKKNKVNIECDAMLTIRKNRVKGTYGRVYLLFDTETKTYSEAI